MTPETPPSTPAAPAIAWNAYDGQASEFLIGFTDGRIVAVNAFLFDPTRAAWMYTHGRVLR